MTSQLNLTKEIAASPPAGAHPERFDPDEHGGGRLMEAEHRGRYWWAAQLAADKDILDAACGTGYGMAILAQAGGASVTGIDLDGDAVAEAARICDSGVAVEGDVRELPFDDRSFDLVVCWETIEHVAEGERVIAEFRRVLRPDGILLVSSPNPDVYPPGNEHHVHEYRPAELAALVEESFTQLASFAQSPRLAASIGAPDDSSANGAAERGDARVRVKSTVPTVAGEETYGIVAASDAPLPPLEPLVALGGDFEVRWWTERVEEAGRKVEEVSEKARDEIDRVETEARRHLTEAAEREAELRARLEQAADGLRDANQELAQMPVLRHRMEQVQAECAHTVAATRAHYEQSRSWRLTAPLRRLLARLKLR